MRLRIVLLCNLFLFSISPYSLAQTVVTPVAPTTNSYTFNPTNGTSTLDQLNPTKRDSVEYEFPSGFRCRLGGGDTPSLVFYGDGGNLGGYNSSLVGNRYGVAFVVPLYKNKANSCDEPMKMYNVLNKLEIAEKMVTTGAMSNEEFIEVTKKIKYEIFGLK